LIGSVAAGISFRLRGPVEDAVAGRGVAALGVGWLAAAGEARGLRVVVEEGGGRRRRRMSERGGRGEKASGERVGVDMMVVAWVDVAVALLRLCRLRAWGCRNECGCYLVEIIARPVAVLFSVLLGLVRTTRVGRTVIV